MGFYDSTCTECGERILVITREGIDIGTHHTCPKDKP